MYVLLENVCQKASKFDDIEIIFGLFFALFVRQLLRIRALLQLHFCLPHKLLSNTMNSFILGMSFPSCKHTILWRTLVIRWNITAFSYSISYRVYILEKWHIVARHTEAVNAVLMLLPYDFPDDVHSPELKYCQTLLCLLFTAPPSSLACHFSLSHFLMVY